MQKKFIIETIKKVSTNEITFRGTDVKERCAENLMRKNLFGED